MQPTRIGNFEIARVADYEGPFFAPGDFFPDFDPTVVEENPALLGPRLIEPGTGKLIFSFHSFVIKTGRHTILVDACIGNDKERPTRPQFHRMKSPFIDDLARLGVKPEDVDYVMCTHLHWDHVGWNTRLLDGKWVPTFPNARYIVGRTEYDYWHTRFQRGDQGVHLISFEDSVLPVVREGRAVVVDDDYELEKGIWLEPCPGHSPGHVLINLASNGAQALASGDVIHHRIQLAFPELSTIADTDRALARTTRTALIERLADSPTVLLPAHFPPPVFGRVVRSERGFAYAAAED